MPGYDSHVHSLHSHDGSERVERICEQALRKGLLGVAVTDHCDIDGGVRECLRIRSGLIADVKRAREHFGGLLDISAGLELGEGHHDPAAALEVISCPELDFVIGSLHCLRGEADFYYIDYDKADLDSLFSRYYDELAEMVECGLFDVVGHINYQVRYMSSGARARADLSRYYERLSGILETTAGAGLGIEVNTSGLRSREHDTLPSREVLGLFRAAGGEIVTTGSDSHTAETIGAGIGTAAEALVGAGFARCAFFSGRKPLWLDL